MTTGQPHPTPRRFHAIDLSLEAIRLLRASVARLKRRDAHLADQVRRALTNVWLNLGEGSGRVGGNRQLAYRRAAGEAHEAIVGFEVAVAWGLLDATEVASGVDRLPHVLAILHKVR